MHDDNHCVSPPQRDTPPEQASDPHNSQPHIVMLTDFESDDDNLSQYFVSIEQHLILETSSLEQAIFQMLASHYVFNVQYNVKGREAFFFLQEKVLGLKGVQGKRSPSAIAHNQGIQQIFHSISCAAGDDEEMQS